MIGTDTMSDVLGPLCSANSVEFKVPSIFRGDIGNNDAAVITTAGLNCCNEWDVAELNESSDHTAFTVATSATSAILDDTDHGRLEMITQALAQSITASSTVMDGSANRLADQIMSMRNSDSSQNYSSIIDNQLSFRMALSQQAAEAIDPMEELVGSLSTSECTNDDVDFSEFVNVGYRCSESVELLSTIFSFLPCRWPQSQHANRPAIALYLSRMQSELTGRRTDTALLAHPLQASARGELAAGPSWLRKQEDFEAPTMNIRYGTSLDGWRVGRKGETAAGT